MNEPDAPPLSLPAAILKRQLLAAEGCLELDLPLEAEAELEEIELGLWETEPVMAMRARVSMALGQLVLLRYTAEDLIALQPNEPRWHAYLSEAVRQQEGPGEAWIVLMDAERRFPKSAEIKYLTACLCGKLEGFELMGQSYLEDALELAPSLRELAKGEPDLEPLRFDFEAVG